MKKILFLLLLTCASYAQTTTGQETEFDYGIRNNVSQLDDNATFITVQNSDGTLGKSTSFVWAKKIYVDNANAKKAFLSTGLIKNGLIQTGTSTTFNITAGIGVISNFDDPENPTSTIVSFPAFTGITPTYLTSGNITYVAINSSASVVMQASPFTDIQRRDLIILGAVIHSNLATINTVNNISAPTNSGTNQLHDLMEAIGALNISGNKYTANGANLSLNKSAGDIFKLGVNFANNWKEPHKLNIASGTVLTFRYRTQNGTEGSDVTVLNPAVYDVANVLTAVPSNRFSIQTVTLFQTGLTRIQYGQATYATMSEAEAAITTRSYNVEANIAANGITRAYIILKNNTTSLQNASDCKIVEAGKFGNVGGSGGAITLDAIIAALGYTPENQANKSDSYTASSSTTYASTKALVDGLATKQNAQYIYVAMSGQSNAVGYTLGTGGDFTVNNDVEVWNTSTSAWEVATSSNTHDPLQNGLNPTSNNIGWQFCKMMQKKTGKKVRYILSALGGISITEWETTGANQYVKLKTAIVNSGIPKLDYFLWHQGEGDVAMASATYETKLKTFYTNLKAETFFGKNTIIVNGQLKKTGGQGFQNITYLRISQDPTNDIRLASSTDLVGWDLAHFTGAEVDIFAQRYFNTALGNERVVYENIASSYVPMNTIFGYDVKGLGRNGIDTTGSILELGNSSVVGEGFLSFGRNGVKTNPVELQSYNGGVGYNPIIIQPFGGRALFGTRTDNATDIIQANGTISANAATTSNQVVIKSQLDAKIGGTLTTNYIPKSTGSSTLGNSQITENGAGSVEILATSGNSPKLTFKILGALGLEMMQNNATGFFTINNKDGYPIVNSISGNVRSTLSNTAFTLANGVLPAWNGNAGTDAVMTFGVSTSSSAAIGSNFSGSTNAYGAPNTYTYWGTYQNLPFTILTNALPRINIMGNGNILLGTLTDDGTNKLQVNGSTKTTALTLSSAPTTSAGTYDILTRNTSTGVVEKKASSFYAPSGSPTFTGILSTDNIQLTNSGNINISTGGTGLTGTTGSISFTMRHPNPGWVSNTVINLKNYTVATLPTGVQGDTAYVTDALAPTYLGVLVGGGTVVTPVFYNGTAWVAH